MKKIWYTFGFMRGRSKRKVDKELRKMAEQFKVNEPADYEDYVNKLLAGLPTDEAELDVEPERTTIERRRGWGIKYYRFWIPVTMVIVVLVALNLPIIGNAVSGLDARMSQMSETEIAEYNEMVQSSSADADTYTREYSEYELARMEELRAGYIMDEKYPDGALWIIDSISEWDGKTPAFAIQTSTFCLPERRLSDEELLEILELNFKREHSVKVMNEAEAESGDRTVKRPEKEFIRLAAEAAKATLDVDVFENEYEVAYFGNDTQYLITFTQINQHVCWVVVDISTGGVIEVIDASLRVFEDSEFEKYYIDEGYDEVLKCISSDMWKKSEVKHVNVEYYLENGSGKLHAGIIRYLVELEDGSGYSCSYNGEMQMLGGVEYLTKCPSVETWHGITDEALEKVNLSREDLQLK